MSKKKQVRLSELSEGKDGYIDIPLDADTDLIMDYSAEQIVIRYLRKADHRELHDLVDKAEKILWHFYECPPSHKESCPHYEGQ